MSKVPAESQAVQKTVQVQCTECGGLQRNHAVLAEHVVTWDNDRYDIVIWHTFQIVQCKGCNFVRFRQYKTCTEDRDEFGNLELYETTVFPENKAAQTPAVESAHLPADVLKMYQETLGCFNSGANTLAAAGLRAIVEAVCKHRKISGANLEKKIEGLVTAGVLAQAQADFLHEERYMGNDAIHEMKTPSKQDLLDGLRIIEGLMNALYILPTHAKRLKSSRSKRRRK